MRILHTHVLLSQCNIFPWNIVWNTTCVRNFVIWCIMLTNIIYTCYLRLLLYWMQLFRFNIFKYYTVLSKPLANKYKFWLMKFTCYIFTILYAWPCIAWEFCIVGQDVWYCAKNSLWLPNFLGFYFCEEGGGVSALKALGAVYLYIGTGYFVQSTLD